MEPGQQHDGGRNQTEDVGRIWQYRDDGKGLGQGTDGWHVQLVLGGLETPLVVADQAWLGRRGAGKAGTAGLKGLGRNLLPAWVMLGKPGGDNVIAVVRQGRDHDVWLKVDDVRVDVGRGQWYDVRLELGECGVVGRRLCEKILESQAQSKDKPP